MQLPSDYAKKIAEALGEPVQAIEEVFEFEEDKAGFFIAKLKPKKFLDRAQFKTMCALARDLGGEGYLQGAKAWKVPGPCAKKSAEKPSDQATDSQPAYKESGSALPTEVKKEPCGVTPRSVTDDRSRPPQFTVPLKALLSMPFQCRVSPEDPAIFELTESIRTLGVLQPILVRPSPSGLYEIVYGQRRAKAAEKAGLTEIPADIRILSDQEAYEIQFTENLQREDLSDMEKARMLSFLIEKFGYTQRALAEKLGKHETWVSKHLSMLEVEKLSPGEVPSDITERQAREILAAPGEKREEILDKIRETGEVPSARELEQMRKPSIPCAHCGDPIQGQAYHFEGQFYDQECYEQVQAEKVPGLLPEPERVEEPEEEKKAPAKQKAAKPQPVDFAEVTCPVCNETFRLVHYGHHDHRPEYYKEV